MSEDRRVRPRRSARWPGVAAEALCAGGLCALSLPPFGAWILAPAGAAILYMLTVQLGMRGRAAAGAFFGAAYFGISMWWIAALSVPGMIAVVAFETALTALACAALLPARRDSGWDGVLVRTSAFAVLLGGADLLRWHWPFGGVPVGSLVLGQAAAPAGQLARVGGPLAVDLAILVLGACLGEAALRGYGAAHHRDPGPGSARGHIVLAVLALGAVCAVALSYLAPDGGAPVRTYVLAAVQGGGIRGLHALDTDPALVYQRELALTEAISPDPGLRLVVWPEDVVALAGPVAGSDAAAQIGEQAARLGATIVAGVTETVPGSRFRNAAVAWSPEGTIVARYDKEHRVPFGEYLPFRSFFSHFSGAQYVPRDAIAGTGPPVLSTPAGTLGVMISFEVFFPDLARAAVRSGGKILLVPTNDASYASGQVPAQEVAADEERSVETGRDLVQVAPTGYTSVVDNRGHLLRRTSLSAATVLRATVSLRTGNTIYDEVGDWPPLALMGVAAAAGGAHVWKRRRILDQSSSDLQGDGHGES